MEVKDILGFGDASVKLLEVISKACGIVYEPIQIRLLASAKANEIKKIDEAISDSNNLIQYSNGNIVCEKALNLLEDRSNKVIEYQNKIEQKNLEDIILNAYENLEGEKLKTDKELDEDWICRFFKLAREINSDTLKIIWGKILSEEIVSPGKCSIRTLEILKNLSKEEAEIFQHISNYIIEHGNVAFILAGEKTLNKYDIIYGEILRLDEALLLNSNTSQYKINLNSAPKHMEVFRYNKYRIKVSEYVKYKEEYGEMKVFPVTKAGRDIFHIISTKADIKYLEDIISSIEKQGLRVELEELD